MKQSHRQWHKAATKLKAELASTPDDLQLAQRFWDMISGSEGYDVRNGKRLMDTFRMCAMKSDDGLAAMLSAFRALANDCGEYPRAVLFDPPLENRLRMTAHKTDHPQYDNACWIIEFLDTSD